MTKVTIDREIQHNIIKKDDLVLVTTVHEFIDNVEKIDQNIKYAKTSVSIVNDNCGAQISKIVGSGETTESAYKELFECWNKNIDFFSEDNKVLLCCSEIPQLSIEDLNEFHLTRTIQFSWEYMGKRCLLYAYVRPYENRLMYIFDGETEVHYADSDKEILQYILSTFDFCEQPEPCKIRCHKSLFYPTIREFIR